MEKMSDRKGRIWANGEFVDWQDAKVHVLSHGLHYGTGVFEGVRAYATAEGPAIFRLEDHTDRLFASARSIGMELPFTREQIMDAQLESVAANDLDDAYLRPVAFYDATTLGLGATVNEVVVYVMAFSWGTYLGQESLEKGIHVGISSFRRPDPSSMMCHAKVCGNYINSVLANQEAVSNGFQEALLLDTEGYLSEGSGENVFFVYGDRLVTPTTESALNGITRQTVIELARDRGIEVLQKRIARDEAYSADEAFFTGTAAEVTPITRIDHRAVGDGKRGKVTATLQADYFDCVKGASGKHGEWLSVVGGARRKAA